jgi:hypothetical protein
LFFSSESPFAASKPPTGPIPLASPDLKSDPKAPKPPNPLATRPHEERNGPQDKVDLLALAVRQDVKKGDVVIAEGDLYQRVYTVVSGRFYMKRGGRTISEIEEGDVFG